jgi:dihydrolipoamide dehydrogenase
MTETTCKLLVIGGGPGGYTCAIRAGQLGIDVVLVEARKPGGTCLNVGCIPSKALIHAADEFEVATRAASGENPFGISAASPRLDFAKCIAWKDGIVQRLGAGVGALMKKANVKVVPGWCRFRDGKTVEVETERGLQIIKAEVIVIATGSKPVALPSLPFNGNVISSTEVLSLSEVPGSLAIVGGGYIGLELGTAFAKMGSKVTVVEAQPRILPQYDSDLSQPVAKRLQELGVSVLTSAKAKRLSSDKNALVIEMADGNETTLLADKILVTVGREPATESWALTCSILTAGDPSSRSMITAAPRCAASMRSATSQGSRCWHIAPPRKANWSPRSSPVASARGTRSQFQASASPTPK